MKRTAEERITRARLNCLANTTASGLLAIFGIPAQAAMIGGSGNARFPSSALIYDGLAAAAGYSDICAGILEGTTNLIFFACALGKSKLILTQAHAPSGATIDLSGALRYRVAT